jgi:hypothetical protein
MRIEVFEQLLTWKCCCELEGRRLYWCVPDFMVLLCFVDWLLPSDLFHSFLVDLLIIYLI